LLWSGFEEAAVTFRYPRKRALRRTARVRMKFFNSHAGANTKSFKRTSPRCGASAWSIARRHSQGPSKYYAISPGPITISNRRLVATTTARLRSVRKDYRLKGPDCLDDEAASPAEFISFLIHVLPEVFHCIATTASDSTLCALKIRDQPRTSQSACRRPATVVGYRYFCHAACTILPLSTLWRPHERDRDLRARLRASWGQSLHFDPVPLTSGLPR
jgi:hypothetical protein